MQYRGVDKFNRSQFNEALGYLDQADKAYAENIPADALNAKGAQQASNPFTRGTAARLGGVTPAEGLLTDPIAETALLGLIEVRRAKASALRALRRVKEADDLLVATSELGLKAIEGVTSLTVMVKAAEAEPPELEAVMV